MTSRFLPAFAARLPLIEPYAAYSQVPPASQAAWKAPFGPAEQWDLDVRDTSCPGPHGPVPVRVYTPRTPASDGARPCLIWMHGGAFAFGDLDMPEADAVARGVAGRAGAVVVSVDYRLCPVPEVFGGDPATTNRLDAAGDPVRFPVPHDDCHAVATAVREGAADLGADPARIAVGGASAGGNLAAGLALRLRDEGAAPWQVLLVYPNLHPGLPERGPEAAAALAGLPAALDFPAPLRAAIHRNYYGDGEVVPYAYAGLAPDLSGFPPTYVEVAELDALRTSGELFAAELREAGVEVVEHVRAGVPHGHLDWLGLPAAAETMEVIAARLRGGAAA